jgi:hypothetical protein
MQHARKVATKVPRQRNCAVVRDERAIEQAVIFCLRCREKHLELNLYCGVESFVQLGRDFVSGVWKFAITEFSVTESSLLFLSFCISHQSGSKITISPNMHGIHHFASPQPPPTLIFPKAPTTHTQHRKTHPKKTQ